MNDIPLEIVITCKDYGDFLNQTLPFTLPHANRVIVVTSFDDTYTQNVCKKWSVEYVPTDLFTENGELFSKGHALNLGLAALKHDGLILSIDADVVLPISFRNMLFKSHLDFNSIYGANRVNVHGWDNWLKIKQEWHDNPQFGYSCLVDTPGHLPLGATLVHNQYGYCPIGFFQLWHSSYTKKHQLRYPSVGGSAEHDDVQWSLRWPRKNRHLLPTVRVFHLESEQSPMGINWNGRKSKPFGPIVKDCEIKKCY